MKRGYLLYPFLPAEQIAPAKHTKYFILVQLPSDEIQTYSQSPMTTRSIVPESNIPSGDPVRLCHLGTLALVHRTIASLTLTLAHNTGSHPVRLVVAAPEISLSATHA